MQKLSLWVILLLILGCGVSDEVKIKDTKEAFKKIEFDHRISENIKEINNLNELIISNRDSILLHNGLNLIGNRRNPRKEKITVFVNSLHQNLPYNVASQMKIILDKLPKKMISATTIYNDGNIIYSIKPEKVQQKPLNYRVQHRLIYGNKKSTNSQLRSVLDALSKETFIGHYQYYIKVEPYNGW